MRVDESSSDSLLLEEAAGPSGKSCAMRDAE